MSISAKYINLFEKYSNNQYNSSLWLWKSSVSPQGGVRFVHSFRSRPVPHGPRSTLARVVEDSCCFVFPTHARAQLSHSRRHLKTHRAQAVLTEKLLSKERKKRKNKEPCVPVLRLKTKKTRKIKLPLPVPAVRELSAVHDVLPGHWSRDCKTTLTKCKISW